MEFECKYQYLLHVSVMSYMNFMEPETVTQYTRNKQERALLASNKTRKFHRKIFHTGFNLYYISKGAVIDNTSSKHALNFVNFRQEDQRNLRKVDVIEDIECSLIIFDYF